MTELARAVYAIARTKRRRWLWCVWWTHMPTVQPFRPPDAWGGGAMTEEQAHVLATEAAGRPVQFIGGPWAGAWRRLQAGLPPFPTRSVRVANSSTANSDPHVVLDLKPGAGAPEIKAAFRVAVLTHHPDRGGDPERFLAAKFAYDTLLRRHRRK